jgi:hypothetical protein
VALSFGTVALLALIKMLTRREARKVRRDFHEEARDVARRQMKTKGLLVACFAYLKTHHGFDRLRFAAALAMSSNSRPILPRT